MLRTKLKEMTTIQTGLVVSRKQSELLASESPHKYRMFTLSSLTPSGIKQDEIGFFEAREEISKRYISRVEDLIMRLPTPNYSVVVDKESENVLIPSQFLCIRINSDFIYPEYLNIYLNSDGARRQIEKLTMGSVIKILSVTEFGEIEIPVPPLEKQKTIIGFNNVLKRETEIRKKLLEAEQARNKFYIEKLLKGESL